MLDDDPQTSTGHPCIRTGHQVWSLTELKSSLFTKHGSLFKVFLNWVTYFDCYVYYWKFFYCIWKKKKKLSGVLLILAALCAHIGVSVIPEGVSVITAGISLMMELMTEEIILQQFSNDCLWFFSSQMAVIQLCCSHLQPQKQPSSPLMHTKATRLIHTRHTQTHITLRFYNLMWGWKYQGTRNKTREIKPIVFISYADKHNRLNSFS